jgi:acetyl/propionyl-CoA carboxylase alpha subunit/acetyl-CoA carboxylase carboxyltransferase component
VFQRIAIVNRGEAAMRLIHAVRELNAERGDGPPLVTIALHTDGERTAMFAREADEAYGIGPASARPYLDHDVLERALVATRADAVWVGWGFVAEDAGFAELCDRLGITFIGPSAEAMRRLGDKIGSKHIAEDVGVPVAPWSGRGVDTLEEALAAADRIGYPLMLKATAGGGGRGIRRVDGAADLHDAYQRTRDEAERAFGSGIVFLEKLVTGARHVEVQVIADGQGTAWALGVRDCTVQRRNQKVIEESSSPLLSRAQSDELKAAAERLALAVDYRGAGTVEFLYHPESALFAFLEVNTRLQVEHPITEVTTDVDLVKAQLHVAAGGRLTGERPSEFGHAIEARLNAEDPDRDFAPSPGRIQRLVLPAGPGIRVDTGVAEGDVIPADFDSMIAKVIAYGRTRIEALARLRRAMRETTVVIEGGSTNKSFILTLLDQPEVVDGGGEGWADTGWIDRVRSQGRLRSEAHAGVALVAAAIQAHEETEAREVARLLETAHGGRPQVQHLVGRPVDLKLRGQVHSVTAFKTGADRFRVVVAGYDPVDVRLQRLDAFHSRLFVGALGHHLVTASHGPVLLVEVDGVTHRVSRDEGGMLRSPAPALVVATPVLLGAEVAAGAPVVVLESMKMETIVPAPFTGRLKELLVTAGSQVETGAPLVRLEPIATGGEDVPLAAESAPVDVPVNPPVTDVGQIAARARHRLVAHLLGFDTDGVEAPWRTYASLRDQLRDQGVDVIAGEIGLLRIFADLAELTRNRPVAEQERTELLVHSDREQFHRYLQSLDVDRSGLPESFRARLETVLAHYGVTSLDRSPALEEAVFRAFLAIQRLDVDLITALLGTWLADPAPGDEVTEAARPHLVRLGHATRRRYPAISDLARSIRYEWFDRAEVERERAAAVAGVAAEAEALADPDLPDRDARISALASIPEQIAGFLAERLLRGPSSYEPLLEVLIHRHYSDNNLSGVRSLPVERATVVADYELEGRPTHIVSTVATLADLDSEHLVATIDNALAARPQGTEAVVELYATAGPSAADAPSDPELVLAKLQGRPWTRKVRRIVVGVCRTDEPVTYYSYRRDGEGRLAEDTRIRGVHPMVGRKLDLWRLREFELVRLPSPDDVLLFECTARANPQDRRLVALAQIRNLTGVYDSDGRLQSIPHAERVIEDCLEAIRRARVSRGGFDRNHVWVHVWPVVELSLDDVAGLKEKFTPIGQGAGIDEVLAHGRLRRPDGREAAFAIRFHEQVGAGVTTSISAPPTRPLQPLDDYATKVARARSRGLVYPYELGRVLAGEGGTLVEHDLDASGALVQVDRAPGLNRAGIICAVVTTPTALHPDGLTRVVLSGDPTRGLGAVAEPECRRIIAALDLAERLDVPVEWFTLSSGARISMDSGTENMDWVGAALRRIVEFTQAGREINVVVAGINVGAQPYWNAEATMLMHTKGVLVMTPDSAMVLTGKQSLDFSGGVSAEDNFGIGGYDRVMGPNGQAQYWAPDLAGALEILVRHYEHTYVLPGDAGPRRAPTSDPIDRDVSDHPHAGEFTTVGEIWSQNPDRKKAFDIRTVMAALADADHEPLERWAGMADAETAVVYDTRIGGHSVCLIGIESRPILRSGFPPTDGPDTYTAGTLFPRSSKKVARAINAASGNRPLVVLANLSGFDGSPESMRNLQLEYGAEIGRAVVNFDGPIVFVVISRYHGGAFVVFSKTLNPRMTVLALEGSYASVIGGAPAAAVVFAGEVAKRTAADDRLKQAEQQVAAAAEPDRSRLRDDLVKLRSAVRAEKISEVAAEFDGVHDIHRAVRVGSVDRVIDPRRLRPEVIATIEAGLAGS